MQYVRHTDVSSIILAANSAVWELEPNQTLLALQKSYERAEEIERTLKLDREKYNANKSRLADKQHWDNRRIKVRQLQVDAEIQAAQLSFASNRLALQRMTPMYPAMEELTYAAVAMRNELVKSGDDKNLRRCAMNNIVMAAQLWDRIYRHVSIEHSPSEAEVRDNLQCLERPHDGNFLAGLAIMRSAFEGTSSACSFLDWKTLSQVWIDESNVCKTDEYSRLEQTTSLIEDFLDEALHLVEQLLICKRQQKEATYQKRLKALGSDDRKVTMLRLKQTEVRAELSSLKAALRGLPVQQLIRAFGAVLMPYHRKSAADYDMAIVNNVVRARQIHIALYGLQEEISSRCGYEDDISFLGLLDLYSQEEGRLVTSHSIYEDRKANAQ